MNVSFGMHVLPLKEGICVRSIKIEMMLYVFIRALDIYTLYIIYIQATSLGALCVDNLVYHAMSRLHDV